MKTAFLLMIIVLLMLALGNTSQASTVNWAVYLHSDAPDGKEFGVDPEIGVRPGSSDGVDISDQRTNFGGAGFTTRWVVAELNSDAYSASFYSTADYTTYPNQQKTWSLRVAGLSQADITQPTRLRFKTSAASAILPPAASGQMRYWMRLVNDRGQTVSKPDWAGGGIWNEGDAIELSMPSTTGTFFGEITLPTIRLTAVGNAIMLSEGYQLEFIQGAVPEPTSLLALGTGLIGLAGLIARRRRT